MVDEKFQYTASHNSESKQHFHNSHLICYEYEIVYLIEGKYVKEKH